MKKSIRNSNLGKAGDSFNDVLVRILAEKEGGSNSN